ncbi:ABC-2 type transport system permease protein [Nonlabens sp. Hel1_33_55]|uniref:ABC transporter permease n=1 Tax=Nonlabens sp. Hel1_33_55 TaxID=1336802 RepID=UPI000875CE79|nr:ABC transporter permease [Nonlabens sp. Hel1_33_55]SCY16516.1 ABC-2 type transport system permease protein [Nonlabens sp. Hel1_33_55]
MDKLWLIIKREYINKVRNRTFVIMTFVSPLIFIGVILLIGWLTSINSSETRQVAILDQSSAGYGQLFEDNSDFEYERLDNVELVNAIAISENNGNYALIYLTDDDQNQVDATIYSNDSPSTSFITSMEEKLSKKATENNLVEKGVNLNDLENARVRADVTLQTYSGVVSSKASSWVKIALGGAAGYLLMMFIIIYGNMVMRSVIEEKTNRIVEIIVSSVKPIYLMLGKITGTSLAGITQFVIWVILGFVLIMVGSAFFGVEAFQNPANQEMVNQAQNMDEMQLIVNDIMQLPLLTLVVCFFIYFIGGYFLYAAIYTAIGAAVDSETDTQQFMLPVILPLMLAIYVGFFSVMDNPNGTVAVIFSYIPLTSPIVMLMRIPFGEIAWWQLAISILLLYTSIIFVAYLAAKIYRIGILMYGKKTNWKELYKWLKY